MRKIVFLLLVVGLLVWTLGGCFGAPTVSDLSKVTATTNATESTTADTTATDEPTFETAETTDAVITEATIEETVLCEQDGVTVTATSISYDGWLGAEINITALNETAQNITIQARDISVNGYMMPVIFSCDIASGKKAVDTITLDSSSMELAGIETISDIEFKLHVFDSDTWDDVFDTDTISLKTSAYGMVEQAKLDTGDVVYDDGEIRVVVLGLNEGWIGPEIYFFIENNSDTDITIQSRDSSVNDFMIDSIMSTDIVAGKMAVTDMTFMSSDLEEAAIDEIEKLEFYLHIFDAHSWDTIVDTDIITVTF